MRHNEVSPAQFELACVYEQTNLAVHHNCLAMTRLREIADRNGFVCLLHEKPFENINGSGKHNNWSFGTTDMNFLNPKESPVFFISLLAMINAVCNHSHLLIALVASLGNTARLGGHEAPPTIISVFLGDFFPDLLRKIAKNQEINSIFHFLRDIPKDSTNRNRTSPFAFTANKFEFRAPGSSQSCADCNVVLNTIVADSLQIILDNLEHRSISEVLEEVFHNSQKIIFNGDG
jgi:glutamine synthetase